MDTFPQIELALMDCTLDDVPDLSPRPVSDLAAAAQVANGHRDAARYDLATDRLGPLLTELQVVAVTGDGPDREAALAALVEAAMVATVAASVLGHTALAGHAAERGLEAAKRLGDPALIGFASWQRALALMRVGARRRAAGLLAQAIDNLAGVDPTRPNTLAAEAYGFVLLTRALLASRSGEANTAYDYLDEGSADRLPHW